MWTSLKNTETNQLVRVNVHTLEKAVKIAEAIADGRKDEAQTGIMELTQELADERGESFMQKVGLTQWSVRVAQDFLAGSLVAIDEDEAQKIAAENALAEMMA
jgi:hypothetical protein